VGSLCPFPAVLRGFGADNGEWGAFTGLVDPGPLLGLVSCFGLCGDSVRPYRFRVVLEMKTFLFIIELHCFLFAVAFLYGGFACLISPTEPEVEEQKKDFEALRKRGGWEYAYFFLNYPHSLLGRARLYRNVPSHWKVRPVARRLILAGLLCVAIAGAIRIYLGTLE